MIILLTKLDHYGIRELSNDWFHSYLKGRQQFVSIGNQASAIKEIVSGVPQGSALGPLLFLIIYINDLHSCIKYSKAYCFADDTNVTLSDLSQETLAKRMNHDQLCEKTLSVAQSKYTLSKYRKNKTCCVLKTKYKIK